MISKPVSYKNVFILEEFEYHYTYSHIHNVWLCVRISRVYVHLKLRSFYIASGIYFSI